MASQDIIQALDGIKLQVQEELRTVREYRALLNIRTAMAELAGNEDLTSQLDQIADQIQLRMKDMREFRALQSVEKSISDMSEVLDLLREAAQKRGGTPKDVFAGVKFAPGLAGKPQVTVQATPQVVAAPPPPAPPAPPPPAAVTPLPDIPAPAEAAPDQPAPPVSDIEADIANVLRVGDRLRLKN